MGPAHVSRYMYIRTIQYNILRCIFLNNSWDIGWLTTVGDSLRWLRSRRINILVCKYYLSSTIMETTDFKAKNVSPHIFCFILFTYRKWMVMLKEMICWFVTQFVYGFNSVIVCKERCHHFLTLSFTYRW